MRLGWTISFSGGSLHSPAAARSNSHTDNLPLVRRRLAWPEPACSMTYITFTKRLSFGTYVDQLIRCFEE